MISDTGVKIYWLKGKVPNDGKSSHQRYVATVSTLDQYQIQASIGTKFRDLGIWQVPF